MLSWASLPCVQLWDLTPPKTNQHIVFSLHYKWSYRVTFPFSCFLYQLCYITNLHTTVQNHQNKSNYVSNCWNNSSTCLVACWYCVMVRMCVPDECVKCKGRFILQLVTLIRLQFMRKCVLVLQSCSHWTVSYYIRLIKLWPFLV